MLMRLAKFHLLPALALLVLAAPARAGFDPQVGQDGSKGIALNSGVFQGWATSVLDFTPGPQNIANPSGPLASAGTAAGALGSAASGLVSLGDGGSITLGFDAPIADGDGADFAVFENGFLQGAGSYLAYLELAFVEVSTNGLDFFRFAATSLTRTDTQVGGFGWVDARDIDNLAGKYTAGYGTGFDLAELRGASPLLDVMNIHFVRIIDVVGSINPNYGTFDSLGNLINDPYSTPFASSGFDLTGVGVINHAPAPSAVPEPAGLATAAVGLGLVVAAARARRKA
jgi:hypothetical protein